MNRFIKIILTFNNLFLKFFPIEFAIDRGEKEKILSVTIELPDEKVLQSFYNLHIKETTTAFSELKYKAKKAIKIIYLLLLAEKFVMNLLKSTSPCCKHIYCKFA